MYIKNLSERNNYGQRNYDEEITIIIPDYKPRYNYDEDEVVKINNEITSELIRELEKEGLIEKEIESLPNGDSGMGMSFPVIALIVSALIAMPSSIENTIRLIERIRKYFENKKLETQIEGNVPTLGTPIFHPTILEKLCHSILCKSRQDLMANGIEFEHVITIDPSSKKQFYHYGVNYIIIFKANALVQNTNPLWEFLVSCTGELLDMREIIPDNEDFNLKLYFDNIKAYELASGNHKNE